MLSSTDPASPNGARHSPSGPVNDSDPRAAAAAAAERRAKEVLHPIYCDSVTCYDEFILRIVTEPWRR